MVVIITKSSSFREFSTASTVEHLCTYFAMHIYIQTWLFSTFTRIKHTDVRSLMLPIMKWIMKLKKKKDRASMPCLLRWKCTILPASHPSKPSTCLVQRAWWRVRWAADGATSRTSPQLPPSTCSSSYLSSSRFGHPNDYVMLVWCLWCEPLPPSTCWSSYEFSSFSSRLPNGHVVVLWCGECGVVRCCAVWCGVVLRRLPPPSTCWSPYLSIFSCRHPNCYVVLIVLWGVCVMRCGVVRWSVLWCGVDRYFRQPARPHNYRVSGAAIRMAVLWWCGVRGAVGVELLLIIELSCVLFLLSLPCNSLFIQTVDRTKSSINKIHAQ